MARAMRVCGGVDALRSAADVQALAVWAQNAWDYLAMGESWPAPWMTHPPLTAPLAAAPFPPPCTLVCILYSHPLSCPAVPLSGDYPYPSTYILNGVGTLPAFPVRAACEALAQEGLEGEALLGAMADAVGVFYNFTGGLECFDPGASANNETQADADFWG